MSTEIQMVETRWERSPEEVAENASRLLTSEIPTKRERGAESERQGSRISRADSTTNESVRARLNDDVRQEEKRRRLLELLARPEPFWNPADHPDIEEAGGAAAWVKRLRHEWERGFQKRTNRKKRK